MARYFTLVENDHRTAKNAVDKEWSKLIHSQDRRIFNSTKDMQTFKAMISNEYQEILQRNPRCKKRELNIWSPAREKYDIINLPDQGSLVIYKEREVNHA